MTNRYIHKDGRSLIWNKSKELWEVYDTNGIMISTVIGLSCIIIQVLIKDRLWLPEVE